MNFRLLLLFTAWIFCYCFIQYSGKAVQIDISYLLNARPVTTLANGKLTNWTKGIDGNGDGDGYLTHAAAEFNGDKNAHALPDNPVFPPKLDYYPAIILHYNNADNKHNQARFVSGAGEFTINIPKAHYSAIYLGLTSSEGPSALRFELIYSDSSETKNYLLPDYYDNISEKYPGLTYVATDLAKWGKNNVMTEKNHHNIDLLKLSIDQGKTLKAIRVIKFKSGYLMFWSATGVVE